MQHDPSNILFVKDFPKSGRLFKNPSELARELLNEQSSRLYIESNDPDYQKKYSNLKALLSQILSGSVKRKLNEDFKTSLFSLLKKKLDNTNENVKIVFDEIIRGLEIKSSSPAVLKGTIYEDSIFHEMLSEQIKSRFVVITTSRPIELIGEPNSNLAELINETLDDLLSLIFDETKKKKYRFNFPNTKVASLYWRRLRFLVAERISKRIDEDEDEFINKFDLFISDSNLFNKESLTPEVIFELSKNFLIKLNSKERENILVYVLDEPVYLAQVLVVEPNEFDSQGKSKGYMFLGTDGEKTMIHKYTEQDLAIWREYVWDVIKFRKSGKSISAESILNH